MRKPLCLILAMITVLMLCACGAEQAPKTIAIEDYNIDGNVEVYSCSCCFLSNGNSQYTLEYTAPAGRSITIFNPPEGSVFMKWPENITTGSRETLTFELSAEEVAAITEITISFCDDNGNCDFVYFWAPKEG